MKSFGIDPILWSQCRTFALNLGKQGFINPISILFTSFKHYYPFPITFSTFTRWLHLDPCNQNDFPLNSSRYPIFERIDELIKSCQTSKEIPLMNSSVNIDQIWLLFSISILLPANSFLLTPDSVILDNAVTRLSLTHKKNTAQRLHCLFAITPSGKYSNQLLICKTGRSFKIDVPSNSFTRFVQSNGDILYEHLQQWLEDFLSGSYSTKNR